MAGVSASENEFDAVLRLHADAGIMMPGSSLAWWMSFCWSSNPLIPALNAAAGKCPERPWPTVRTVLNNVDVRHTYTSILRDRRGLLRQTRWGQETDAKVEC
jgi:hypothetical protein